MKVLRLPEKMVEDVNDSFGARLIEQGKAIPAGNKPPAGESAGLEEETKPSEEGREKRNKKKGEK